MSIKSLVKQVLIKKENRRYEKQMLHRKLTYGDWLKEQEKLWSEGRDSISQEFVLIIASKGKLASYATKSIDMFFDENPETMILYGDEDLVTDAGEYDAPWFKPDWSPDFLDSCLYFGSLVAVRVEYWRKIREAYELIYPGFWQQLFAEEIPERIYHVTDLTAYEKWLHYCVSAGYAKDSHIVGHVSQILFHSREEQKRFQGESDYLKEMRRGLLNCFFEISDDCEKTKTPAISVIIPSKDHPDILQQCVESVKKFGAHVPFEILVVDNGSEPENKVKTEELLKEEASVGINGKECSIRYLYQPMEFNFSRMCNLGADEAKGKLLLFLNDDVTLEDGCVAEMAARAVRGYTGAVGVKLLYPDTGRIQHAGITNLPMGPVHKLQSMSDDRNYYGRANDSCRNFLAVTAACLMVEKKKFQEAGGFPEELKVAFNDVDFCFRLYELGYFNVCINDIYGYHHESLSRGDDESEEKLKRLLEEREILYRRHPQLEGKDPFYSDFLNRDGLDVRIAPAYMTAGNHPENISKTELATELENYREDKCLMVRVEDARRAQIVGWSVVLGDDNACYAKKLLLRSISEQPGNQPNHPASTQADTVYEVVLEGQYRPDLEENMPDQKNVALSGFWVELHQAALPRGIYQIGVAGRNRVTGMKLLNWSNRILEF